ncbi:LReO_3 protein [Plakobranchus ocellatus]|uniref:LReO_3 protein n=1 Tax=Plakobranchus ocellatus TaxID=259542 RepID=A0AAV4B3Y5_9GAST|nr:LReO_3 protein [Plakobranchus ocellatus]
MEFNFMPFGLSTASSTFQRAMSHALRDLPFVVSYFDDVLIFSETWSSHVKHIQVTLTVIENANLTVRPSKTHIEFGSIYFLGHTISQGKVLPDKEKTEKMRQIKTSATKKEVKYILGLLNYYRRFAQDFSKLVQPLTELTKARPPNKVAWTAECEASLNGLKSHLTEPLVLNVPDLNKTFVLQSDASDFAVSAPLLQEHNRALLPCYYASRKLLDREHKYCIAEKELGQCINAARYCSTLDRLKEAIRRKRPGLLRRGVVLQHDNATPHSANLTQQWLQRYGWEILPHPAHSPDLAPSDFHLFGPLKCHLGGMAFETEDDLISELRNWFDNLDVDFFRRPRGDRVPDRRGHCADVCRLSDNEAWVATVSQPEKTTCGGTVPELLGTALTQRPEADPAPRGIPYAQRETLRLDGRPNVPRKTQRPEGDPKLISRPR